MMMTPDEEVAARIIGEFKKAAFLSSETISSLEAKLAQGTISAEDWRLIFESDCLAKNETNEENQS